MTLFLGATKRAVKGFFVGVIVVLSMVFIFLLE
jgi:hypothetical protein